MSKSRNVLVLLFLIILLGFALRFYKFDSPIADWHSWRQADTSSVSRNFATTSFDFLHPRFDDLSNVPTDGMYNNPQGYRFVEFPIYNLLQAGFFKIFGFFSIEEWGRLVTIFSSSISIFLIFSIVKKHSSNLAGLIAAFFFATIPYSIFYGRAVLPDPTTSLSVLLGIYFFDEYVTSSENSKMWTFFSLSLLFIGVALLLKPFAIFFIFPILYLAFKKFGLRIFRKWFMWLYLVLALVPLALWRIWILQFPEGIPVSSWLFNEGNIRFKGSYFYWIFAERISKFILGYFGVSLFTMGFLSKVKKENLIFFLTFVFSSFLYLVVIARGNVQHDYYQILIFPTIAIFLGLGGEYLLKSDSYKLIKYSIFISITFFTLLFGWYHVRDYYNVKHSIVDAGKIIDEITPKDSKIIAEYAGDTTFLYQSNRKGWASLQDELPRMVEMGAEYLAFANPKESDLYFSKDYEIVYSSETLLLYDLKNIK